MKYLKSSDIFPLDAKQKTITTEIYVALIKILYKTHDFENNAKGKNLDYKPTVLTSISWKLLPGEKSANMPKLQTVMVMVNCSETQIPSSHPWHKSWWLGPRIALLWFTQESRLFDWFLY